MDIQIKDKKIFAPLKNKWLMLQPEEEVRQKYICRLVNNYGFSLAQMEQEVQVTNSQRGQGRARADIVVWRNTDDKVNSRSPIIIVECKAESITIHEEDYFQGYNYASWAGAEFFVTTNLKETRIFKVIKGEIPQRLEEIIDIPNAKQANNQKEIDKLLNQTKAFTRDEFSKLLFKCHNIIRNNDKLSPEAAFDEISKVLFIKIRYERQNNEGQIFSYDRFVDNRKNYDILNREMGVTNATPFYQNLFEKTKQEFANDKLFDDNAKIEIRENSFEQIVKELQIYNLSTTSDDVKGIAFEQFLGKTFRGELGQFFTPRTIVNFMVSVLDPQEGEYICDPCCGSGGFLIKAFEYVREKIEKDIVAQKEKIKADLYDEKYEKMSDDEKKQIDHKMSEVANKLNEELNILNDNGRLRSLSYDCIYGTDANPRMARTSKMNMIMHGDGHGGVHHHDGLLNVNGIFENRFDVILTNPPFGARVEKDLKISYADMFTDEEKIEEYTARYGEAYKEALKQVNDNINKSLLSLYKIGSGLTEVLFIERRLNLLVPGGRMGIVLPEGVLNNTNLQKVRDFVESKAKILLIVSIPQDVFIASGATVKPSLLFFKKFNEEEAKQYADIEEDATNEVNKKYADELSQIDAQLAKRGKEALPQEKKKELRTQRKKIEGQKASEIKAIIKERFDYQIPIAEVQKAGISTTGTEIENELIPLAEEFMNYRKGKNLWSVPIKTVNYNLGDDGAVYRIRIADNETSEPEIFYGVKK
ncbi:N-6 DNA methylase [Treponema phagedenis]|uniref:N-6 DNA methylase n=1 Tax=Treponema phagedenis TaxID=162 RepID=UPI0001F63E0A|nr:N-6 DNA methylase [Treponema phagedenis]EFW38194.1 type I restriction enzyme HsdR protein N-terminal domain protein [Treponema phagedenis F0421]TYT77777.1 N-6 DNA methylase [Treponema phagedenis]